MKNTEYYYNTVRRYRQCLTEINAKFDKQIEAKAGYAGSPRYTEDVNEIERERAAEIAALRADCRESFDTCIKSMRLHAESQPMTPPTQDQLALLQALQMREHLTRDDLEHAANSMQGCVVALGVLDELSQKHELYGFHANGGGTLSDQFLRDAIQSLAKSARTLLTLDRTNQRRELMDSHGQGGGQFGAIPSFAAIGKFKIDVDPESAQDCAGRFGGVPGELYEAFTAATGGE